MTDFTVPQGTTGPTIEIYAASMVSTDDWACTMRLLRPDGTEAIGSRAVTDVNEEETRFVAFITDAETAALAVDIYTWAITLTNSNLDPAFAAVELHTLIIEPDAATRTGLELVRGENSFCDYPMLISQLDKLPGLYGINTASRITLKTAVVEAWYDIGALCVNFGKGLPTSRYLTATALDALTSQQQNALVRAQLVQADYILTTPDTVRDASVRSNAVGESVMVFRNNRRVIVCAKAMEILRPYLNQGTHMQRGFAHEHQS